MCNVYKFYYDNPLLSFLVIYMMLQCHDSSLFTVSNFYYNYYHSIMTEISCSGPYGRMWERAIDNL